MTALPSLSEVEKELDESGQSAWKRLLEAEKLAITPSASALVATVAEYNNLLVGARVVGFFILDFKKHSRSISFAERAHRKLVQQVHSLRQLRRENVSRISLTLALNCRTTSSGLVCCAYCSLETQSDHHD